MQENARKCFIKGHWLKIKKMDWNKPMSDMFNDEKEKWISELGQLLDRTSFF